MERLPLRTAFGFIALIFGAAGTAASFEPDQRGPSVDRGHVAPRAVPEAVLTALQSYAVRLRSADDNGEYGFGLIVAQNGSEVVIATAAHVVLTQTDEHASSIFASFHRGDGKPDYEVMAAFLPGQDLIDKFALDLAFLVVKLPQPLMLAGAPAAPRSPRPGEQVWIVAPVADAPWSPEPGTAGRLLDKDEISFDGGSAQTGSSGAPLATRVGVTGLVRSTTGATTYAIPLSRIRTEFERRYANRYRWVMAYAPLLPDAGLIRATRTDPFTRSFPIGMELAGGGLVVPLPFETWQEVPEGRYTLRPGAAIAGIMPEIICQPDVVQVRAFTRRPLSVACRPDPAGLWDGPRGRLKVTRVDVGSYSIVEQDPAGRELARGTGNVFGDVFTLVMISSVFGAWNASLTLKPGTASGQRVYTDTHMKEDVSWFRESP